MSPIVLRNVGSKKGLFIVAIGGMNDRNKAETLRGKKLYIQADALPETEEDDFYHADLHALDVRSPDGVSIGKVHALHNFGAGDVIEVKYLAGDTQLLSFDRQTVPEINIEAGYITLVKPEEWFVPSAQEPEE